MTSISGVAIYIGYLRDCVVFADYNNDGVHQPSEPHAITDDFGGWLIEVFESKQMTTRVRLQFGGDCIDTSTSLALQVPLAAPAQCGIIGLYPTLKLLASDALAETV